MSERFLWLKTLCLNEMAKAAKTRRVFLITICSYQTLNHIFLLPDSRHRESLLKVSPQAMHPRKMLID